MNDLEGFQMAAIVNFGIDSSISPEAFAKSDRRVLADQCYQEAMQAYQRRKQELMRQALPVFQNVRLTQGSHIENVVVPFTDGRKSLNVLANLDKTLSSKGLELVTALEKTITLAVIDDAWKEHLRTMDDLKQSVQTAVYEQKDPLVIYKTTAYELFSNMNAEVNKDIVSFLCHVGLPEQSADVRLREGREQRTDMSRMRIRKDSLQSAPMGPGGLEDENPYEDPSANVRQEPVKTGPKVGRNDPCPCGSGKKYKQCHGREG